MKKQEYPKEQKKLTSNFYDLKKQATAFIVKLCQRNKLTEDAIIRKVFLQFGLAERFTKKTIQLLKDEGYVTQVKNILKSYG